MLSYLRNDIVLVGLLCCTFFIDIFGGGVGKQKVLFINSFFFFNWLYHVAGLEFLGRPETCDGLLN